MPGGGAHAPTTARRRFSLFRAETDRLRGLGRLGLADEKARTAFHDCIAPGNRPVPRDVTLLIPVYNDAASARLLLERIDGVAAQLESRLRVLFVDDGSSPAEVAALPGPTEIGRAHV